MSVATAQTIFDVVNCKEEPAYQPFNYPAVDGGVACFGEIALFRTLSYSGNFHAVGFWRVGPSTSPLYSVPGGDETGFVIEGSATIQYLDGQGAIIDTREIRRGDVYMLEKGTLNRWIVHEPFKKLVIVVDDAPPV